MLTISLMSSNVPGEHGVRNSAGRAQLATVSLKFLRAACRWRRHGTRGSTVAGRWRCRLRPSARAPASPTPAAPGVAAGAARVRFRVSVPMFPWRLLGALALSLAFVMMGREIQRLVTDQPWSDAAMWWSIAAGAVAGVCVLGWTWSTALNARRLVEPARSRELPDPNKAVVAWLAPFAFVGVAVGIIASLGEQISRTADEPVSSLPLVVAVAALLLAIPLTYRPFYLLSGMIRQVGGHSARLSQWMWVPSAAGRRRGRLDPGVAFQRCGLRRLDQRVSRNGRRSGSSAWLPSRRV